MKRLYSSITPWIYALLMYSCMTNSLVHAEAEEFFVETEDFFEVGVGDNKFSIRKWTFLALNLIQYMHIVLEEIDHLPLEDSPRFRSLNINEVPNNKITIGELFFDNFGPFSVSIVERYLDQIYELFPQYVFAVKKRRKEVKQQIRQQIQTETDHFLTVMAIFLRPNPNRQAKRAFNAFTDALLKMPDLFFKAKDSVVQNAESYKASSELLGRGARIGKIFSKPAQMYDYILLNQD